MKRSTASVIAWNLLGILVALGLAELVLRKVHTPAALQSRLTMNKLMRQGPVQAEGLFDTAAFRFKPNSSGQQLHNEYQHTVSHDRHGWRNPCFDERRPATAVFIGDSYTDDTRRSQFADVDIPVLSDIPWVGETVLSATPVTYLAVALGIGTWFVMNRTGVGLGLRAVGESASTADAAGHSVLGTRAVAVLVGGAFAGLSGAYLTTTAIVGAWSEGLTAGRGWIAVALVIFGAWRAGRVATGAVLFGFTLALQTRLQPFGVDFSPILLSMFPYILTVIVLIIISIRARHQPSPAPAGLGIAYRREER